MTAAANPFTGPTPAPTADAELVIKCASLTKTFRDFWLRARVRAVDNIDLDVRKGEVFGLLGPNGSGKSTTIKMLLGLLTPTSGRISVLGKRPEDVETKRNIGYLPEESYLYRFLNARETLDYYGRLFHQPRDLRRKRIDMLLEMVGLESVARRPVGEYSKGMQRRIGLAQALINDPQLLILDEPTTGLDPVGSRQIRDLIIELSRRGKTILLCSHLLSDVEDVCHRVAIMFGGKVRAQGTCAELLTVQGLTTLQTDTLDADTIQAVENLLESRGKHIERVERPRQKLEDYFMDMVKKAHAEGASTSGARNTGKIAEFLRVDAGDTASVIDNLIAKPKAVEPEPVAARPAAPPPPAAAQQVVSELAAPKPVAPAPAEPARPQVDAAVVNELLSPAAKAVEPVASPAPPPRPAAPTPQPRPVEPPAPAVKAPAPAAPASAPAKKAGEGDEKPDQAFIDALLKVPPFKGEAGGKKPDEQSK